MDVDDIPVPSIVESLTPEYIKNFKFAHEQYYEEKYFINNKSAEENVDVLLRIHTNRVTLVYLSSKHTVLQGDKKIKEVCFEVKKNLNRAENHFTGKGKTGAQLLQPNSILCLIKCEDGTSYPVYAGIYGKLVEINENLLTNPNLLSQNRGVGYIAIVVPNFSKWSVSENQWLSPEIYKSLLRS